YMPEIQAMRQIQNLMDNHCYVWSLLYFRFLFSMSSPHMPIPIEKASSPQSQTNGCNDMC
ncbi:MAG: hypothetical protein K2F94_09190, partial [Muribaculaceae bacterium]|nr:hypothetical protein [Muribaculaceae bacterium]